MMGKKLSIIILLGTGKLWGMNSIPQAQMVSHATIQNILETVDPLYLVKMIKATNGISFSFLDILCARCFYTTAELFNGEYIPTDHEKARAWKDGDTILLNKLLTSISQ